jgi:PAS domain S-box-containing protein
LKASGAGENRGAQVQTLVLALIGAGLALAVLAYGMLATRDALETTLARQGELRATQMLANRALRLQLDEETGIRGYVSTGQTSFLEPYFNAHLPLESDLEQLAASLSEHGASAAAAAAVDARHVHERWLSDVHERLLPSRKTPRYVTVARAEKVMIDRFRADMRTIDDYLATAAASGTREIGNFVARFASYALLAVAIAVVAVILAAWRDARAARLARDVARLGDFRTLSAAFDRMAWTATPEGAIDFCSERWTAYTGLPQARLLGGGWQVLPHPEDLAASAEAWRLCVATGNRFDHVNRMRRIDGEYRWLRHQALPLRDRRNGITAWAGESTDVHEERVRLESLRERYETEKRVADTLQRALLSETLPSVPGLVLDAVYRPASVEARVGGDWYDIFVLPGGRVLFSVGDVAGHGLEAAVAMNKARQIIIATSLQEQDPERVLARANATLNVQGAPIVTALCGFLDPKTGEGTYASAGHPPPLIATPDGRVDVLPLGGLPLGSRKELAYRSHAFRLVDDALFVVYTDGALEYGRDVLAGERRLHAVISSIAIDGGSVPAQRIYREIFSAGQPSDDVAILVTRFAPLSTMSAVPRDGESDVRWEPADSLGM